LGRSDFDSSGGRGGACASPRLRTINTWVWLATPPSGAHVMRAKICLSLRSM
jgi:hypothetical protein